MQSTKHIFIHFCLFLVAFLYPSAMFAAPFSDVLPGDAYYQAVSYLKEKNLISGDTDGSFQPDKKLTRGEALAMILKPKKTPPKNPPAYDRLDDPITLVAALRMLFKTYNITTKRAFLRRLPDSIPKLEWFSKDISYAMSRGIIGQQQDGRIFSIDSVLTRGEMTILLYRFLKNREGASFGYASWYGDGLAKTKLPAGTEYRDQNLTAAHKTLPFGTIVRVTNMRNGKQVDLVINDRGPFVTGRIIDLSKTAFSRLASSGAGVIQVEIEKVK